MCLGIRVMTQYIVHVADPAELPDAVAYLRLAEREAATLRAQLHLQTLTIAAANRAAATGGLVEHRPAGQLERHLAGNVCRMRRRRRQQPDNRQRQQPTPLDHAHPRRSHDVGRLPPPDCRSSDPGMHHAGPAPPARAPPRRSSVKNTRWKAYGRPAVHLRDVGGQAYAATAAARSPGTRRVTAATTPPLSGGRSCRPLTWL